MQAVIKKVVDLIIILTLKILTRQLAVGTNKCDMTNKNNR